MINQLKDFLDKKRHSTQSEQLEINTHIIYQYIHDIFNIIERMGKNRHFLNFLSTCNQDTYTIQHPIFPKVLEELKKVFEGNDDVYLTFISIKANEDSLDNFGRSRQHECKIGLREKYLMSERSWYKETDKQYGKPTMTLPYRDTSGSYIISFTKAIFNKKKEVIGVVGLDINLLNILKNINTSFRYLIVASRGEILFDSKEISFNIYQNKFNLMMLVKPDVFYSIMNNDSNKVYTQFDNKKRTIYYKPIIVDKYYFIQVNEKTQVK